jgi:probable HAF family extracellular repeat protein
VSIGLVTIDLGTVGGDSSNAYNVNEAGQIAGTSTTSSGEIHAFLWQNGVMTDLGTLGGSTSRPTTILPSSPLSEAGHVIGLSTIAGDDTEAHSFIWHDGVMRDLGTLGGWGNQHTEARAVNSILATSADP